MLRRKPARVGLVALFWALASTLAAPSALAAEPSGDPAAAMYGPETVVAIDLTLPPGSVAALEADPTGDYQDGTFSLAATDGTPGGVGAFSAPIAVGIRLKGKAGSFRPLGEKSAFKVKFSHVSGQRFLGLKKLTLNNMVQDPSMVHETLSYTAFRALGVDASRTGYAFVRLNGEPLGVYLNVEDLDDVALKKRFGTFDDPQHIYEGEYGTDTRPGEVEDFEVDEGEDTDLSDLEALAAAATDGAAPDWSERVDPHADLAQMTRMWAVEKYAGHWDGYAGKADEAAHELPNNYYLYSDPLGRFQMLPWGTDQTWEERVPFDGGGGLLFERCRADASCDQLLEEALGKALATVPGLRLDEVARCTAQLLAPWQALEDPAIRPYEAAEIAAGVTAARAFAADRPFELGGWLGVPLPIPAQIPLACGSDPKGGGEEPKPKAPEGQPSAGPSEPPALAAPSLRLRRIVAKRGALVARFAVGAPGELSLRATLRTRKRTLVACAVATPATSAGPLTVRCPLSEAIQQRRRAHWLRLHLKAQLTSAPAPPAALTTSIALRRTVSPR